MPWNMSITHKIDSKKQCRKMIAETLRRSPGPEPSPTLEAELSAHDQDTKSSFLGTNCSQALPHNIPTSKMVHKKCNLNRT